MLKHCTFWEEMMLGKRQFKRMFAGCLFGKIVLKRILKDEKPLRHSTVSELIIAEKTGDTEAQKAE